MALVQLEPQRERKPAWLREKMPCGVTYFE
jgi:hypothetical protein